VAEASQHRSHIDEKILSAVSLVMGLLYCVVTSSPSGQDRVHIWRPFDW